MTKEPRIWNKIETLSSTNGIEQLDKCLLEIKDWFINHTLHGIQFKEDQTFGVRPKSIKLIEENIGKYSETWTSKILLMIGCQ